MKKLILLLLVWAPVYLMAQNEGEIHFAENVTFQIDLPEGMEEFKDKIPTSQSTSRILLFNEKATLYKNSPMEEAPEPIEAGSEDGGFQFKMKFDRPESILYSNLKDGETIHQQDFMGKKFLVSGEVKKYKWKMTGEQKVILDQPCMKATYQDTAQTIVAWFSPQIPVSLGPHGYGGLPGMILEMDFNEGERTIVASKIDLRKLDKKAIEAPKKGKKVTSDEFEKIQEEKMKEMEAEHGGGGTRVIIRH